MQEIQTTAGWTVRVYACKKGPMLPDATNPFTRSSSEAHTQPWHGRNRSTHVYDGMDRIACKFPQHGNGLARTAAPQ